MDRIVHSKEELKKKKLSVKPKSSKMRGKEERMDRLSSIGEDINKEENNRESLEKEGVQ